MKATVAVRRGSHADRDFVRDLGRRSAASSISAVRTARYEDVALAFERLVEFVLGREHECLIAVEGETPIGFLLMLYDVPDEVTLGDQAFIAYTAIEPFARGRGVGRALLEVADALARERGRRYMSLMVTEDNLPARTLYDGAGFVTERRMMTKPL
jgi:ribosomal protein S18 acetylase RimI-like enzyme